MSMFKDCPRCVLVASAQYLTKYCMANFFWNFLKELTKTRFNPHNNALDFTGEIVIDPADNAGKVQSAFDVEARGSTTLTDVHAAEQALLSHNAKVYIASRNAEKDRNVLQMFFLKVDLSDVPCLARPFPMFGRGSMHRAGRCPRQLHDVDGVLQSWRQAKQPNSDHQITNTYLTKLLTPVLVETAEVFRRREGVLRQRTGSVRLFSQSKFSDVVVSAELVTPVRALYHGSDEVDASKIGDGNGEDKSLYKNTYMRRLHCCFQAENGNTKMLCLCGTMAMNQSTHPGKSAVLTYDTAIVRTTWVLSVRCTRPHICAYDLRDVGING
ncbi:hypothetical protein FISHEDRAFT_59032 [Fistulina hepatica ATCC 64428]|uniref:Uncharacterized protein n=1 Tax=Fistulina hepatica ATCC 64428 TaxID=1128425 RepID=A0A0D7AC03_9AGAR|nr:hypothetical protein FISHEDRAFT_59032 [Fistulina hepatica ATCC 64428]